MIAALLLLQSAAAGPAGLGAIGRQTLPAHGCAAYLWSAAETPQLVAMAGADPATLRIALDGRTVDLARSQQSGEGGFGFAGVTAYAGTDVVATLNMTITADANLTGGASVPQATLRIDRRGGDSVVVPVAGLIGCT